MTVTIGGWLLVLLTSGPANFPTIAGTALVVKAFDTAEDCETARERSGQTATHRCIPAVALAGR